MTNRDMVKSAPVGRPSSAADERAEPAPEPGRAPLPPMPAPESEADVTTTREPVDSPQVQPTPADRV